MENSINAINELLVGIFNDILEIEQNSLNAGMLNELSVTEIHTIDAIGVNSARTMSEVASDLNITIGTLTTAITNLVKKGYVDRKRTEEDRRLVLIQLSMKGKLAFRIHRKFHRDMVKETINGLSEIEEKVLVSALKKLSTFFESKCFNSDVKK
ncbi:MAG: MarR family transcriptional regulator [Bacillota bacterium]|nr:MarR family transcriptional regulator [Bacillota bacterium]